MPTTAEDTDQSKLAEAGVTVKERWKVVSYYILGCCDIWSKMETVWNKTETKVLMSTNDSVLFHFYFRQESSFILISVTEHEEGKMVCKTPASPTGRRFGRPERSASFTVVILRRLQCNIFITYISVYFHRMCI